MALAMVDTMVEDCQIKESLVQQIVEPWTPRQTVQTLFSMTQLQTGQTKPRGKTPFYLYQISSSSLYPTSQYRLKMSMDLDGPVPFSGIQQDQPVATYVYFHPQNLLSVQYLTNLGFSVATAVPQ
jgi:hypothetical protein